MSRCWWVGNEWRCRLEYGHAGAHEYAGIPITLDPTMPLNEMRLVSEVDEIRITNLATEHGRMGEALREFFAAVDSMEEGSVGKWALNLQKARDKARAALNPTSPETEGEV